MKYRQQVIIILKLFAEKEWYNIEIKLDNKKDLK